MARCKCPSCGGLSLVLDGKSACCDVSVQMPVKYRVKRESGAVGKKSRVSPKVRGEVLERQDGCCLYCGDRLDEPRWDSEKAAYVMPGYVVDHFNPWCWDKDDRPDNLVASCRRCNSLKSDMVFRTVEDARRYICSRF